MEISPFPELKISDFNVLDSAGGRNKCPKCGKSRKYYCYVCYVLVMDKDICEKIPKVQLPIKIDILKHPSECDGKSTSPHAAVLAPDDVTIYEYPCIPDYNPQSTILVFPGEEAVSLESLVCSETEEKILILEQTNRKQQSLSEKYDTIPQSQGAQDNSNIVPGSNLDPNVDSEWNVRESDKDSNSNHIRSGVNGENMSKDSNNKQDTETSLSVSIDSNVDKNLKRKHNQNGSQCNLDNENKKLKTALPSFDRVLFIDSTWNQTTTIANDERLKHLRRVELMSRKTKFWRNHDGNPDTYLSTIEAIYYFVCDYHNLVVNRDYNGEYDNLLYFFSFTYSKIREHYKGGDNLKAYSKRQKKGQDIL